MNWNELIALLTVTTITIVTPGPDFLVVVRNTISGDRFSGIKTAFGVSTAIWVHIAYSVLVMKFATSHSDSLMNLLKYSGACYLFYLGINAIRSSPSANVVEGNSDARKMGYWLQGFLNNLLNPKATLFFLSVFSQFLPPSSKLLVQLGSGLLVTIICLSWFSLVPFLLTTPKMKPLLAKVMNPIEKISGFLFVGYAIKTILS